MAQLKAVFFDVDDTLFSTTRFASIARHNAVTAMVEAGLDLPVETVERELVEVINEFSSNYDHHFDQLLRRLRPPSLARVNSALVVAAGVVAYHNTKFRELAPFDDVYPLLEALRAGGLTAGIITHGWTTKQSEKLVRLGLLPYLDPRAVFISDQIGIAKPNPKLYARALRDLELSPPQTMYVGDNLEHDVAPPKSLGMRTVWARRAARGKERAPPVDADHVVDDFVELLEILKSEYGLPG